MSATHSANETFPASRPLGQIAYLFFAFYLIATLGANSVARAGGPLAWLPLVRLPAGDGNWEMIGAVGVLPAVSVMAWLAARARAGSLRTINWGWGRVSWPLAALAAVASLNTTIHIFSEDGSLSTLLRLLLLLVHLAWVYLYVTNERPALLPIIAAVIAIQSTVAIGQFITQRDLGLYWLGELALDPSISGVSVVVRGSELWLRGYGLSINPNTLAGTLATLLAMLLALGRDLSGGPRRLGAAVFALGVAGLLTTLSRSGALCLGVALAFNLLPWLWDGLRHRRWGGLPLGGGAWVAAALITGLFAAVYGDTISGRVVDLGTPTESRSISERGRDTAISLAVIAESPLLGVGLGEYLNVAQSYDPEAKLVHTVPLHLAAEIGIEGLLVWLWLVAAPLLRRGALSRYAAVSGLWLTFWLFGLVQTAPNPLYELRSALLAGLVAGVVAWSGIDRRASRHEEKDGDLP